MTRTATRTFADAVVSRDRFGTPSIEARTERSAWFALGYAQAEDHLLELLGEYLAVRGELASVFGIEAVESDLHQRRWQVLDRARADLAALPAHLRERHEAFTEGIGRYVADHPEQVPDWAPDLEPALPLGRLRTLIWPWAIADALEALRVAGVAVDEVDGVTAMGLERGSNAWALAGSRTEDGGAILLAEPHVPLGGLFESDGTPRRAAPALGAQFTMFEFALAVGDLVVSGVAPVGTASPAVATTPHVAWALTTGQPNCSDAYRIALDPDDPSTYRVDDDVRRIDTVRTVVQVADRAPVSRELAWVDVNGGRAPVVARGAQDIHVVSTPYLDDAWRTEVQLDAMLRATSVDDVLANVDLAGTFPQNVVIADVDGGIAYVRAGRVPVRPAGVVVGDVLDGNTAASEWVGIHPSDDLLRVVDPVGGFIQVCNTAPDTSTGGTDAVAVPSDAPYLFNDELGRTNTRSARVSALFAEPGAPVTEADAVAAATDDLWVDTAVYQAALRDAVERHALGVRVDDPFVADLLAFDGHARADSTTALRWQYWREALLVGEPRAARWCAAVEEGRLDRDVAAWLVRGIAGARTRLRRHQVRDDARYGDVFRVGPDGCAPGAGGSFARRPAEPGESAPPWVAPLRVLRFAETPDVDGRRPAVHGGPALRLSLLRRGDVRVHHALLAGQSSTPGSPHAGDQAGLLARRQLRTTHLDPARWTAEQHDDVIATAPTGADDVREDRVDTRDPDRGPIVDVGAMRFTPDGIELIDDGRHAASVDPDIRAYLDMLPPPSDKRPPSGRWAVKLARKNSASAATMMAPPTEPVHEAADRTVDGPNGPVPVRVYRPTADTDLPVLVFIHGGAFVVGDLDSCDSICRMLARRVGAVVVSVDYRLAPEHPFPAGLEDCYAATRWATEEAAQLGGDPRRVCIIGDSAGASLAAGVTLLAKQRGGPDLAYQVLINPTVDHALDTPSAQEFATGYLLTVPFIEVALEHYLQRPGDRDDPLAAPLRAPDLSDLPPGLVLTAGNDPLRDEGERYGDRLRDAGNDVLVRRYSGAVHGWFTVPHVVQSSRQVWTELTAALRYRLRGELPAASDAPEASPAAAGQA